MFKSSRKKLFAVGCSYTEKWNGWKPWPEVLADKLDMDCVNLGLRGAGNDEMLAKVLEVCLTKKHSEIGLVVVMWSEWQRLSFQRDRDWTRWHHIHPSRRPELNLLNVLHPRAATRNTIRTFIHADKLLGDIPYLFVQGCDGIFYYSIELGLTINTGRGTPNYGLNYYEVNDSREKTVKAMINNPYMDYIEKNIGDKFIGWPIMREIGGYSMDDYMDKFDPTKEKFRISENDYHPNENGHKLLAEKLYDEYQKIYL